ncbi:MAG: hypothetical protein JWM02_2198 [Frankiales bacterium]|nr:hypothetical protein [Frankiales bacterium]
MSADVVGPATTTPAAPQTWMLPSWPWTVRAVGIGCLLAAEVSNTAQLRQHFADWSVSGGVLVAVGAAQGLLAAVLTLRPSRRSYQVAAGVGVVTIWLWLVGLPFGPHVGHSDALRGVGFDAAGFQMAAAAASTALASRPKWTAAAATGRGRGGTVVAAVLIGAMATALAVLAHAPTPPATGDELVEPATVANHSH